eukprot:PITA_01497
MGKLVPSNEMPLQPQVLIEPFEKRALDFVGPINPPSRQKREIVTDQSTQFTSKLVQKIVEEYKIKHWKSTPYHPQANIQVEATNKVLEAILTKTIHMHRRDRAKKLREALWAYRTTWRNTTGRTPYELVYGKQVFFPIEFQIKTFETTIKLGLDLSEAQKQRMEQLNELDEIR